MERIASQADGTQVRKMRAEDVDAVVAIETESFSSPWRRETFLELIDRPTAELLVMEHIVEGVIGYAVLWCILDQGELANVAIAPRMRGLGLGRALLGRVLDVGRERGVETVFLEVRESNARALGLYQRFGFAEVGHRRGYYDHPKEDARILMAKL
jgi:ribosomal-protein-alanine N-acetyltransferase